MGPCQEQLIEKIGQDHVLNPDLQVVQVVLDLESTQEGENLSLHPLEVDPDLLPDLLLTLLPDPHPH